MPGLSDIQQTFLNNYIRKHKFLGKKKSSDALKFTQRKGEVEALLRQLPSFSPVVKELRTQVEQADQRADVGEFKSAYKLLDKAKSSGQKAIENYDPTPDTQQIMRQMLAFVKNGQEAAPEMILLNEWRQARKDTPPPSTAKSEKFLKTANTLVETFVSRIMEIGRASKSPKQIRTIDNLRNEFWSKVTADDLGPLRRRPHTFLTYEELKTLQTVQGGNALTLTDEMKKDQEMLQKTKDKVREMRTPLKTVKEPEFCKDFVHDIDLQGTQVDFYKGNAYRELPGFIKAKGKAKQLYMEELNDQLNTDTEEKILSLLSKSKDDLYVEIWRSKNWPTDAEKLTPEQIVETMAIAEGMREAIAEKNPNKLDLASGTVTIGGEVYKNPKELARGANGKVQRFESQTTTGKFIVLKTNFAQGFPDETEQKTSREALEQYYALQGDDTNPGKKNICKLEGLVSDENGASHIAIEYAPGGDVDQNRFAMTAATECGALPEECRSLLNQFLLKQAVVGISYLHDQNMMHNDLKPGNMMLDNDGNLRIVDFGESVPGEDTQGKVSSDKLVGTPGYDDYGSAKEEKLTLKGDDFSLGVMAGVMERGQVGPRVNWKEIDMSSFTGALGNFAKGLSAPDPEKRPTLESVLNSSYLENLKNYNEEDVKQLMQTVIEYGKAIDVTAIQNKQNGLVILRGEMNELQKKMRDPITDNVKKQKLLEAWQQKLIDAETLQDEIRVLGSDPKAEDLLRKIRELSDKLQGRNSTPDEEGFNDFVQLLGTTKEDPHQFRSLAGLRSYDEYYLSRNIDPAKIRDLVSYYDYDLTETNGNAKNVIADADKDFHEFISKLSDESFQKILTTALTNLFGLLLQQYKDAHRDDTYDPQFMK